MNVTCREKIKTKALERRRHRTMMKELRIAIIWRYRGGEEGSENGADGKETKAGDKARERGEGRS